MRLAGESRLVPSCFRSPVMWLKGCGLKPGWPQQRLRLLKAGWPHRFPDALQAWGWSTCSSQPRALGTGWIHWLAWKQRSSWGKLHQRSAGVICLKRSRAMCQVLHLRKHCPLSQRKYQKRKTTTKIGNGAFSGRQGPFQWACPTFGWDGGEGSFSWHQTCSGLLFSELQSWSGIKMLKKRLWFVLPFFFIKTDQTCGLSLLWLCRTVTINGWSWSIPAGGL